MRKKTGERERERREKRLGKDTLIWTRATSNLSCISRTSSESVTALALIADTARDRWSTRSAISIFGNSACSMSTTAAWSNLSIIEYFTFSY